MLEETVLGFRKKTFWRMKKATGIYLDGSFGVGKTHLLAASFHQCNTAKAYLSFTDLMALISFHGAEAVFAEFKQYQLICIDEFELDDPANTMKASNFIRAMFAEGNSIITTSNTVPHELGKGRFGFKNFENEIGLIAENFNVTQIDGPDYRAAAQGDYFELHHEVDGIRADQTRTFEDLKTLLEKLPLVKYAEFASNLEHLHITGIEAFKLQDHALRFTHLIDKIYDQNKRVSLHFLEGKACPLFVDEFLHGSYQKKYKRCLSRLHELTRQS